MEFTSAFSSFAVDDTEKAKQFYGSTLGLEIDNDPDMSMLLRLKIQGMTIMVYPRPDHVPAEFTVLNFTVANIDETVDQLTAKGVEFKQYADGPTKTDERGISGGGAYPRIAWFSDPAGNILSIIED